jgi:protein-L-isoaspartate O-methyltransferase
VTAVFHRLAPQAVVIGIDHLPGLVNLARTNLSKDGVILGTAIDIVCGDGRAGWSAHGEAEKRRRKGRQITRSEKPADDNGDR